MALYKYDYYYFCYYKLHNSQNAMRNKVLYMSYRSCNIMFWKQGNTANQSGKKIQQLVNRSTAVNIRLFISFCACFFLGGGESIHCMGYKQAASCFNKCITPFFGYSKYYHVTNMLLELGSSRFHTCLVTAQLFYIVKMCNSINSIISQVRCIVF